MVVISAYLIAAVVAWIVAQGLKYVLASIKSRTFNKRQLYLSGGMPSAHSASVVALLVVIGLHDGIETPLFALAALFAGIVMYDAVMVRRSSGEQGESLTQLIKETKSSVRIPRAARGHTPLEVIVGAFIGFVIGLVVFFATF